MSTAVIKGFSSFEAACVVGSSEAAEIAVCNLSAHFGL